jgi:carbonic anhydrase
MAESHVGGMFKRFFEAMPQVDTSTSSAVAEAKRAAGKADFLLLNCIDYRYPNIVNRYVKEEYPGLLYDQVTLAGASLAASEINTNKPHWRDTVIDHVEFAIRKHGIYGVLILNHRTCGAFVEVGLLPETGADAGVELSKHRAVATAAAGDLISLFHQKGKPGAVVAFLTPEVTNPAACDFDSDPVELCALTT